MAQRMGDCRNANITPVQIRLAASMGEPGTKDPGREGKGKMVYIVEAEKRKNSCNRQRKDRGGEKGVWQFHK